DVERVTASIERMERAGYVAWSADEQIEIGGWTVRSSGGFTRRLNSAKANGRADTSIDTKRAVAGWLAERGASLAVRVTPLIDRPTVERCASTWGLSLLDETIVLARRPTRSIGGREVLVIDADDEGFAHELMDLNGRSGSDLKPWSRLVRRISPNAAGLWIPGQAVAFVAIYEGVASLFSLAVLESSRRIGVATKVMNAAFTWASARDAETLFIQVLGANVAGLALYERLGFDEMYRYHYLQPSSGGSEHS
ncbi:MAG: GNAT family N-acetyltransferase, partial [Actinomycetia bacterium]|nr:GNAT family N-acetyltransferase [Actinomycetes bacterium]